MKKLENLNKEINFENYDIVTECATGESGEKLSKLNKTIQNMNDRFNKDIQSSRKRCQAKIPEIKSYIEFINFKNDQYKERMSVIEDKMINYQEVLKKAMKKMDSKLPSTSYWMT